MKRRKKRELLRKKCKEVAKLAFEINPKAKSIMFIANMGELVLPKKDKIEQLYGIEIKNAKGNKVHTK